MKPKFYVTMTDKVLSGWGPAKGKTNKLIFECDSYDEAVLVAENANNRTDMKYISITSKKPYYSEHRYYAQYRSKDYQEGSHMSWYKPNFGRNEE